MTPDLLNKLLIIGSQIRDVAKNHEGITWSNAFSHPEIVGLRDSLLDLLGAADTASAMIASVEQLNIEFDRLYAIEPRDWDRLSAVAMTARGLSYVATAGAAEPIHIFVFSMRQLLPWLERALQLGVAIAVAVV